MVHIIQAGQAHFDLGDIVKTSLDDLFMIELTNSQKNSKTKPSKTLGTLYVSFDSTVKSSLLQLRIQGEKMKQMRFCANNMNVLEIFKPKSRSMVQKLYGDKISNFEYIDCLIPDTDWILVARTEAVNFNQLVIWRQFDVNSNKLCFGNPNFPIKLVVKDYAINSGSHKVVGGAIRTLNELMRDYDQKDTESIHLKNQAGSTAGYLRVMQFFLSSFFKLSEIGHF